MSSTLRTVQVTRYITPLREGGSLPALVEADDQFLYVLKFRGAGQGNKALIAELLGGEIARTLGFRVPEIVFAELDAAFGRIEGDEEIQDLLKASTGLNLGLHYLSGAITFDPVATKIDAALSAKIVWLDALLLNVDRTARNTNMLRWHQELWLIDHGASLYFHHAWPDTAAHHKPFPHIKDHVLLPWAENLASVSEAFVPLLTPDRIAALVALIPDVWLTDSFFESAEANRQAYADFLNHRIGQADLFVNEANEARAALV